MWLTLPVLREAEEKSAELILAPYRDQALKEEGDQSGDINSHITYSIKQFSSIHILQEEVVYITTSSFTKEPHNIIML